MIKRLRISGLIVLCGLLWGWTPPASAASSGLQFVPQQAEVAFDIGVHTIMNLPVLDPLFDPAQPNRLNTRLQLLTLTTGLNLRTDLDHVYLFGQIGRPESVGVVAEGRFDTEKLLLLVKTNDQYATSEFFGITVHQWYDRHENRMKYGAFNQNTILIITNSKPVMEACLTAGSDAAQSIISAADALIPAADRGASLVWGILRAVPEGGFATPHGLNGATYRLTLDPNNDYLARLSALPADEASSKNWLDLLRGVVAYGNVQNKKAEWKTLAAASQVVESMAATQRVVTLETLVRSGSILEAIQKRIQSK